MSTKFQSRIHQLNVTSAFLYAKFSDPIFVELPKGHPQKAGRSKVWFTHTAIYGLVEAPKVWNSTIHQFLVDWGLRSLYSKTCLYVRNDGGKYDEVTMLLLLYVDAVLYVGIDSVISAFKDAIRHRFKIKKTTWTETLIGIEVDQEKFSSQVLVTQADHIQKAVSKFELEDAKSYRTPIELNAIEVGDSPLLEEPRLFQQLLGLLNYVSDCSQPDIAFAVSYLARKASCPTVADLQKAKRCLVHLRDTKCFAMK